MFLMYNNQYFKWVDRWTGLAGLECWLFSRLFIYIMLSKSFPVQQHRLCPNCCIAVVWKGSSLECIPYLLPSRLLRRSFPFYVLLCFVLLFSLSNVNNSNYLSLKKADFLLLTKKIPVAMVMLFVSGDIEFQLWWISQAIHLCWRDYCCGRSPGSSFPHATYKGCFKPDALRGHWISFLSLTPVTSIVFTLDKFYSPCRTGKLSLRMVPDPDQSKSTWSNCFCDQSKWLGSRVRRGRLALLAVITQPTGPMMPLRR